MTINKSYLRLRYDHESVNHRVCQRTDSYEQD